MIFAIWYLSTLVLDRGTSYYLNMSNTEEREQMMDRVKLAGEIWEELLEGEATAREKELAGQYPKMPRERVLRMVAREMSEEQDLSTWTSGQGF